MEDVTLDEEMWLALSEVEKKVLLDVMAMALDASFYSMLLPVFALYNTPPSKAVIGDAESIFENLLEEVDWSEWEGVCADLSASLMEVPPSFVERMQEQYGPSED